MEMSKAAIAPCSPVIRNADREHPLFPLYQQHLSFCAIQLIEADRFDYWLAAYERDLRDREIARHPRYQAFVEWMRQNQGGARKCPAGVFPHNFHFWLEGGRW